MKKVLVLALLMSTPVHAENWFDDAARWLASNGATMKTECGPERCITDVIKVWPEGGFTTMAAEYDKQGKLIGRGTCTVKPSGTVMTCRNEAWDYAKTSVKDAQGNWKEVSRQSFVRKDFK